MARTNASPHSGHTRRRILRTPEAAEYLGLASSTVEKMRLTGGGPRFVRLGGRAIGYDIADLDAWLDGRREDANASTNRGR